MNRKSSPADLVDDWCEAHGWPRPIRELLVAPGVRAWKFDLAWPGLKLALEIDGGAFAGVPCATCGQRAGGRHNRGAGMREDYEKLAEAKCRGWQVLGVMPEQIESRQAIGWLARIMRRLGVKRGTEDKN